VHCHCHLASTSRPSPCPLEGLPIYSSCSPQKLRFVQSKFSTICRATSIEVWPGGTDSLFRISMAAGVVCNSMDRSLTNLPKARSNSYTTIALFIRLIDSPSILTPPFSIYSLYYFPQESFNPTARLNTALLPCTWSIRSATKYPCRSN
jgi:hypothetical protein